MSNKKKERRLFIDVDPFRSQFGPVSEQAIYDVYRSTFKIENRNMHKHSFQKCVTALRRYKTQQQKENK